MMSQKVRLNRVETNAREFGCLLEKGFTKNSQMRCGKFQHFPSIMSNINTHVAAFISRIRGKFEWGKGTDHLN
jgi:hypothetical protein